MDEERKKYILDVFLRTLWISLIVLVTLGALIPMTIFLGWWKFLALCLLGLLAGCSMTAGVLMSPKFRGLIAIMLLVLGALIIPALAIYLGSVAARNRVEFNTFNASLIPFIAYSIATFLALLLITTIWQRKPKSMEETQVEAVVVSQDKTVDTETAKEPVGEEGIVEEEVDSDKEPETP